MQFRYIGSGAEFADRIVEQFGAVVELEESAAKALIAEDLVALVPESIWEKAKIADEEAKKYFAVAIHSTAPPEFIAKRDALWANLREYRAQLQNPTPEPVVTKEG